MGIDCVTFQRLVELSQRIDPPRRSLMLGRQGFNVQGRFRKHYRAALSDAGLTHSLPDLKSEDGYSERCLDALGFGQVEAMDLSDYEGAQHVHDLNEPIGSALAGQFDFVFDGGTIEHVFDVATALRNVFDMLAPGGVFVSTNGLNGWPGHGLYQFNPDIVWSFWKRAAGCEVLRCAAVSKDPGNPPIELPDPADKGIRLRRLWKKLPQGQVYLYYEVRKPDGARLTGPAQQSDYAARWASAQTHAIAEGRTQ